MLTPTTRCDRLHWLLCPGEDFFLSLARDIWCIWLLALVIAVLCQSHYFNGAAIPMPKDASLDG
eukprot:scaffold379754_cov34-Prasinocladus_malaysianus.AAC.1